MILETTLFLLASWFHHNKPKQVPESPISVEQLKEDRAYVGKAIAGLKAFQDDALYAQYERPEMDAFADQLDICVKEFNQEDVLQFDNDVNILLEYGTEMQALDEILHTRNVI